MRRLDGKLAAALTVVALLAMSWRRWCEPMIDFGRELYVPWQLSLGKSLYRDIAYFNGPISPYFNALLFRVFGDSLLTLAIANALLLILVLMVLHSIVRKIADETVATVLCVCLVPLMCIAQPWRMGNYNFITPYSHEMTHGLLLSLIALWALMRGKAWWEIVAGLCAGLTILTKPEFAIACCGMVIVGAAVGRDRRTVARIVIAMVVPPSVAAAMFGNAFIAFAHLLDFRLTSLPFYRLTMGTYDLVWTAKWLAIWSVAGLAILSIGERIAARIDRKQGLLLLAAVVLVAIFTRDLINWDAAALPLVFVNAWAVAHAYRKREWDRFAFAMFSSLLLAKILLHVTLSNYGFALALPAVCVAVCFFSSWRSGLFVRHGNGLRYAAIGMLVVVTAVYFSFSIANWRGKKVEIGVGPDRFFVSRDRGNAVEMLEVVKSLPENATVAILPQGVMLNYLARLENSTGFIVLMPPEVLMFGEDRMVEAFARRAPEFILIDRISNLAEYGYGGFTSYAPQLAALIDASYEVKSRDEGWILLSRRTLPQ